MFKHVPNILTLFRFILIPFIFISITNEQYLTAFIILTISGITDILDGFIARKFNFITNFGKLIDPLSDKATQICVLLALVLIVPELVTTPLSEPNAALLVKVTPELTFTF